MEISGVAALHLLQAPDLLDNDVCFDFLYEILQIRLSWWLVKGC